jgi:membrane protein YdbS with pleckstrin-like domain
MKGAVVAMVPSTREILALYSNPSFDPNDFVGGIPADLWRTISQDSTNPLLDRAVGALYPPASTFKLVTAAAGLEKDLVEAGTEMPIPCNGGMRYAGRYFGDWYGPPGIDLSVLPRQEVWSTLRPRADADRAVGIRADELGGVLTGRERMVTQEEHTPTGEREAIPRRLHAHVVWHWRASLALSGAVTAGVLLLLDRFINGYVPAAAVLLVLGLTLLAAWVWPPLQYRGWAYQIRQHQLWAERGVLSRTTSVIPYVRIQHVDTRQSPVERALGIARVVIFTAGIRGAEFVLPGLPVEEASRLREELAELAGVEYAV